MLAGVWRTPDHPNCHLTFVTQCATKLNGKIPIQHASNTRNPRRRTAYPICLDTLPSREVPLRPFFGGQSAQLLAPILPSNKHPHPVFRQEVVEGSCHSRRGTHVCELLRIQALQHDKHTLQELHLHIEARTGRMRRTVPRDIRSAWQSSCFRSLPCHPPQAWRASLFRIACQEKNYVMCLPMPGEVLVTGPATVWSSADSSRAPASLEFPHLTGLRRSIRH